jgi:hypothetical protein
MIDELFFNIDMMKWYKEKLKELREADEVDSDKESLKMINDANRYYQQNLSAVVRISSKVGLTAKDRIELKIAVDEDDGFDD